MKRWIDSIKNKFYRVDKEKVICFILLNDKEAYNKNPEFITYVQRDLSEMGVLTAKHKMNLFCVSLTNPNIKTQEILKVFKKHGLKARVKKKGKEADKYQKVIKILPKK